MREMSKHLQTSLFLSLSQYINYPTSRISALLQDVITAQYDCEENKQMHMGSCVPVTEHSGI